MPEKGTVLDVEMYIPKCFNKSSFTQGSPKKKHD